jgi:hypothetical protein
MTDTTWKAREDGVSVFLRIICEEHRKKAEMRLQYLKMEDVFVLADETWKTHALRAVAADALRIRYEKEVEEALARKKPPEAAIGAGKAALKSLAEKLAVWLKDGGKKSLHLDKKDDRALAEAYKDSKNHLTDFFGTTIPPFIAAIHGHNIPLHRRYEDHISRRRFFKVTAATAAGFGLVSAGTGMYAAAAAIQGKPGEETSPSAANTSMTSGMIAAMAFLMAKDTYNDLRNDDPKIKDTVIPGLQALTEAMSQVVGTRMRYVLDGSARLR